MKMLIKTKNKDSFYALPEDKQVELSQQAMAWAEKHVKSGECKALYFTAALHGTLSIWEATGDARKHAERALENPMWGYQEVEYQPLYEWDDAVKGMAQALKK